MQHVDVGRVGERKWQAMKRVSCFDERHVERTAVEGDQRALAGCPCAGFGKQCALVFEAWQQELPNQQLVAFDHGAADEKGLRPGAACEARRFEIEKKQTRRGVGKVRGFADLPSTPLRRESLRPGKVRATGVRRRPGALKNRQCVRTALQRLDDLANPDAAVRAINGVMAIHHDHGALGALDDGAAKNDGGALEQRFVECRPIDRPGAMWRIG